MTKMKSTSDIRGTTFVLLTGIQQQHVAIPIVQIFHFQILKQCGVRCSTVMDNGTIDPHTGDGIESNLKKVFACLFSTARNR